MTSSIIPDDLSRGEVAVALLRPVGVAVILLVAYFLLPFDPDSDFNVIAFVGGALLLLAFCIWEIRRFTTADHPIANAIEAIVAVAGFYIVVFATTYYLLSEYHKGAFLTDLTRVDALYFCLTVFTTTGFGDIAPDSQPARIAVSAQMVSTLILVGLGLRLMRVLINAKEN